uniref:Ribosomal RNA large subunit methyltransferase L n=1 Tax=Lygus hesperus TaxID=30085 RepID=A0A0A9Y646_LYGHE
MSLQNIPVQLLHEIFQNPETYMQPSYSTSLLVSPKLSCPAKPCKEHADDVDAAAHNADGCDICKVNQFSFPHIDPHLYTALYDDDKMSEITKCTATIGQKASQGLCASVFTAHTLTREQYRYTSISSAIDDDDEDDDESPVVQSMFVAKTSPFVDKTMLCTDYATVAIQGDQQAAFTLVTSSPVPGIHTLTQNDCVDSSVHRWCSSTELRVPLTHSTSSHLGGVSPALQSNQPVVVRLAPFWVYPYEILPKFERHSDTVVMADDVCCHNLYLCEVSFDLCAVYSKLCSTTPSSTTAAQSSLSKGVTSPDNFAPLWSDPLTPSSGVTLQLPCRHPDVHINALLQRSNASVTLHVTLEQPLLQHHPDAPTLSTIYWKLRKALITASGDPYLVMARGTLSPEAQHLLQSYCRRRVGGKTSCVSDDCSDTRLDGALESTLHTAAVLQDPQAVLQNVVAEYCGDHDDILQC